MVAASPPGFAPPTTGPRPRRPLFAAAAVAIGVVVAIGWIALLVVFTARTCACPAAFIPLGAAVDFAPASSGGGPSGHWANFTVRTASTELVLSDLRFSFTASGGGTVPPSPGWSLLVANRAGTVFGVYDPWTGGWNSGASASVVGGSTFHLATLATDLSGGTIVVEGLGSFTGTILVPVVPRIAAAPTPIA